MSRPRWTDQIDLAAVPSALSCAQMFVEVTLTRWNAVVILDQACNVARELVRGAIQATGVTDTDLHLWQLDSLNLIKVRVVGLDASILIEVWDCNTQPPTGKAAVGSHRWGYFHPFDGGRVVWCELALPPPAPNAALPRRVRRPQPGPRRPIVTERNPELLQRVLDGLRTLDDLREGGTDMED